MRIKKWSLPPGKTGRFSLLVLTAFLLTAVSATWAFKQGIHETITEDVLQAQGWDEDSADEVGDSNYWTDVFESSSDAAHADNNHLGAASARLRGKITTIRTSLASCERRDALDALGEALHTVQDVYSHSNSVDNGIPVGDILNMEDGTAPCDPDNNFAPGGLVTGYFNLGGYFTGNQCRGIPEDMCCHRDLNKDDADVPNGDHHDDAVTAAEEATRGYLDLVEDDIRDHYPADTATQLLKMLKRKQRTVMFVIDTTGSMSTDISGVKSSVNSFLDGLISGDEAPTLGLVTFKDYVSNYGLTCDIETLRSQVNSLYASGGGDCPEAMNSGLLTAIFTFPRGRSDIQIQGGRILSATDASAWDAYLGPHVQFEAASRGIAIDAILTGDCTSDPLASPNGELSAGADVLPPSTVALGPGFDDAANLGFPGTKSHTDPTQSPSARVQLKALTEQTGGVLFSVSRVEVDDVVPTLLQLSDPGSAVLLGRRVDLSSGNPVTVDIPVDDTLGEVTFLVTGSTFYVLPTVTVTRPDGTPALPGDPDVTRRTLSSVVTNVITDPAPGIWHLTLQGTQGATVRAFGPTALRVNGLRQLTAALDPPRPEVNLAPLDGQPLVGEQIVADIRFSIAPGDAGLSLVRDDGSLVAQPMLTPLDARRFTTEVAAPGEPFLWELRGQTAAGYTYVRQVNLPIQPRLVAIVPSPRVSSAPPGESAPIDLVITNQSPDTATFGFVVSTPLGWGVTFVTGPVTVPAGETVTVSPGLLVHVPSYAPEGARNDMAIRVQDLSDASLRNNASFTVVASSANQPPDCGSASPSVDVLWPPNHKLTAVEVLGVTDPDGDPVTITIQGITQDEPVDGLGSGDTAPDGQGVGTSVAEVRAERSGTGDGRVYAISFAASDGKGGTCTGQVQVGVPHSQDDTAVDSGQSYDSTSEP